MRFVKPYCGYLHSTLVLLKVYKTLYPLQLLGYLHSTLVLLKATFSISGKTVEYIFTFYSSSIKGSNAPGSISSYAPFTFYSSSIKGCIFFPCPVSWNSIYILL